MMEELWRTLEGKEDAEDERLGGLLLDARASGGGNQEAGMSGLDFDLDLDFDAFYIGGDEQLLTHMKRARRHEEEEGPSSAEKGQESPGDLTDPPLDLAPAERNPFSLQLFAWPASPSLFLPSPSSSSTSPFPTSSSSSSSSAGYERPVPQVTISVGPSVLRHVLQLHAVQHVEGILPSHPSKASSSHPHHHQHQATLASVHDVMTRKKVKGVRRVASSSSASSSTPSSSCGGRGMKHARFVPRV